MKINKYLKITNIKFLGIIIDNTLTWKTHTEMRTPKLSSARYMSQLRNLLYHRIF